MPKGPPSGIVVAAVFVVACGGSGISCARNAQAGLTNAPGINRPTWNEDRGRDAIANGPDSCTPPTEGKEQPLKNRWPKCPEATPAAPPLSSK
jgi:hypothetical protein